MTHHLCEDNPAEVKIDSSPIPLGRVLLQVTRRFLPASSVVNIESLYGLFLCFGKIGSGDSPVQPFFFRFERVDGALHLTSSPHNGQSPFACIDGCGFFLLSGFFSLGSEERALLRRIRFETFF